MKYPNLYIVGAMKAGTTTIFNALSLHPEIFVPAIKEPNYFCTDLYKYGLGASSEPTSKLLKRVSNGEKLHYAHIQDYSAYSQLFDSCRYEKYSVDCSTTYLYSSVAAYKIASVTTNPKIIIILRNPIHRAFSEFLMNCSIGIATPPFHSALDLEEIDIKKGRFPIYHRYVTAGLYFKQINRYFETFGRSNVLILNFDQLKSDYSGLMKKLFYFLEIPIINNPNHIRKNSASYPRSTFANYWIEKIGIKNIIRNKIPHRIKNKAKTIYYNKPPDDLKPTISELARLRTAFGSDLKELSELLEENFMGWINY